MAVAGDVIIKLAADFAQFSEGMTQSTKALGDFGKQAEKTNATLDSVIGVAKLAVGAFAAAFSVEKVIAYTDNVQRMSVEIAKVADKFNISAREAQALQLQAESTGLPLEKLAEYAKTHAEWLENATLEAEKLGLVIDGSVVRSMKAMNDEAEIAQRRFDILFAGAVTGAKSWILDQLDRIVADFRALSAYSGVIDTIIGAFRMMSSGSAPGSGQLAWLAAREAAVKNAETALALEEHARSFPGANLDEERLAKLKQDLADKRIALEQYKDQQRQEAYGPTMPATVVLGDRPTGGGGGGGHAKAEREVAAAKDEHHDATVALTKSMKQLNEEYDLALLATRRYDDDLGSLAAGFETAARQYERANDLFSQGGEIFGSVTDAMGEGLDALLGKSSRSFGQIASDFATMLAKMALQAALSPVFKLLANSVGGLFGSGVTMSSATLSTVDSNTVWQSMGLTGRAGGGAVYAGQPYWVGEQGPERFVPAASGSIQPAGGGDVIVNIANYTDSKVSAGKSKGPGGQMQVDVIVEAVEGKMAARLSRGQGSLGKTIEGSYGLQRVGR